MRVGDSVGSDYRRSHRRKRITGLTPLPLTIRKLKIARTNVVEGGVAKHTIEGATRADILRPTPYDNRQFGLVIHLRAGGRQDNCLTRRNHSRSKFRKHDRSFRNRHITFSRVVPVVEPDADQFPGTRHWSEPIRVFTLDQPTVFSSLGKRAGIANECCICLKRLLKPWPIHIEPGQEILRTVGALKQALAIQTVSGVTVAVVQNKTHSRRFPLCVFRCERYDLHCRFKWSTLRRLSPALHKK